MSNLKMVVNEKSWEEMTDTERSWLVYRTLQSMDKRIEAIEKKRWVDSAKVLFGSIIGGAAAAIGINIGGYGR